MIRWPGLNWWNASGSVKVTGVICPGTKGVGCSRLVAEFAAHHLCADELLIAAHDELARVGSRLGRIVRIDVDQLHDPVGVGAARRDIELGRDRTGDDQGLARGAVS